MNERKTLPNIRFRNFKDEWKLVYLGDIGFFKSGIGFPRSEQGGKKGIPFYKVSDLGVGFKLELAKSKNYVTDEQIRNNKWKVIDPTKNGAVVFAKIGAAIFLNRKRMVKRPFLIDNNLMAYIMSDKVNREFVMNILQMINFSDFSQVGAIPSINSEELKKIKVRLPKEILQQQKIGDFFTKLDKLLDLQQQKIDKLELLKKALLQKLFPKHDAKIPELRFKGFEDVWRKHRLKEVSKIIGGGTPDTKNPKYWNGNINWFSPNEIGNSPYAVSSHKKITDLGLKKSSAKLHPAEKTILFTSRAGIGDMAILTTPAATNQGFQSLELNNNVDSYFVYSYGFEIKKKADRLASGSTFLEISKNEMEKITLMFPSEQEQQKIGNLLSKVDQLIELENKKLQNLQQVKKCLLQNMFVD